MRNEAAICHACKGLMSLLAEELKDNERFREALTKISRIDQTHDTHEDAVFDAIKLARACLSERQEPNE